LEWLLLLLRSALEVLALLLRWRVLECSDLLIDCDTLRSGDRRLPSTPRLGLKEEGEGRLPNLGLDNLGPIIQLLEGTQLTKHEDSLELGGGVVDNYGDGLPLWDR